MLRVIVAENNVVVRALIVETLRMAPEIEVVGEAWSGAEVIEMTRRLQPGLVIMGAQLQKVDSLEATKEIMTGQPTPIVLVTHDANSQEADIVLSALEAGALAVVSVSSLAEPSTAQQDRDSFLTTVKAMSQVKLVRRSRRVAVREPPSHYPLLTHEAPAQIVAIAASTGGPAAIEAILARLPANFPAPILIVQHIANNFIEGVASWLDRISPLTVKVAKDHEPLDAGTVYLGPDWYHLGVSNRSRIRLADEPPIGGFQPSATYLFESVAQSFGAGVLGVILTGMGQDGVDGLRTVRARGGRVIAQDEASSVVFGMPRAAIEAGIVTEVLPISKIAETVINLVQADRSRPV